LLFAELEPALARGRWPVAIPLALAVVAGGGMLAAKAANGSAAGWERAKAERVRRLTDELAARLSPGDTVQVLDTSGGGIHALLRLRVTEPTRFVYDFHFFHDTAHPVIRPLRAEPARRRAARARQRRLRGERRARFQGRRRVERSVHARHRPPRAAGERAAAVARAAVCPAGRRPPAREGRGHAPGAEALAHVAARQG